MLFDDRCSDKCQNLDERFDKHRQMYEFLRVPLKPHNFCGVISGSDNDCQCFTSQKHHILLYCYNTDNKHVAFKGTHNDVTRQAELVGDSYSSKTTPKKIAAFKGTAKTM